MKKIRKKFLSGLLCFLLLLSLAACGGNSGGASSWATDNNGYMSAPQESEVGWATTDDAPREVPRPEPAAGEEDTSNGGFPAGVKVILTADLELETKEFDQASQALESVVAELGGWFENRSLYQGGSYRRLSCVIRVPSARFSTLLDQAGEVAHMISRDEYSEDVSEAYYDSEARLTTQRTKQERLQELLAQASSMEDIIALENALSETELQIEYLTGSLRRYDSLVGYSTITLQLREVYRLSTDDEVPVGFGQRLGSAFSQGFQRGMDNLEDWIIAFASNWMTLLLLVVILALVVLALRRLRRKKKSIIPRPQPKQQQTETGAEDKEK